MGLFDINYTDLVNALLPVKLRGNKMKAFLNALAFPVAYLYGQFMVNRNNNLYYLGHNSQVCYLRSVLNDTFDPINREITITDGEQFLPVYIYLSVETIPSSERTFLVTPANGETFNDVWLYTALETQTLGYDFVVNVPSGLLSQPGYSLPRLKALTDKYRLPSKYNYQVHIV